MFPRSVCSVHQGEHSALGGTPTQSTLVGWVHRWTNGQEESFNTKQKDLSSNTDIFVISTLAFSLLFAGLFKVEPLI